MFFALSCVAAAFIYFQGLGSCLLWFWRSQWPELSQPSNARKLQAAELGSGLALHHALTLAFPYFSMAWWAGAVLALAGWWTSQRTGLTWRLRVWPYSGRAGAALILFLVCFTRFCISGPIDGWDARSIWFFHAKILYYYQSLHLPQVWNDPAIDFSHTPYPKLLPALAALCARLAGGWNDTFPRLGFVFLGLPAFFCLASLRDRFWPLAWIWYALVLSQYSILSFGYADGFHALYASLALLFFARALKAAGSLDTWQAIACLGLALQIKNEGGMVAAVLAACLAMAFWKYRRPRWNLPLVGTALVVLAGWILWAALVKTWGVREPLPLGGGEFASRVLSRLGSGVPVLLNKFFWVHKLAVYWAIVAVAAWSGRRGPALPWTLLLGAPLLFTLALSLVYLGTPHDFNWHIGTSIDRTSTTIRGFLVVAAYFAFSRAGVARDAAQPDTERAR